MESLDWEIVSFVGVGPVKFGMTAEQVADVLGPPRRKRVEGSYSREGRARDLPVIHYRDGQVSEIEAFRDMATLRLGSVSLFGQPGRQVLARLEALGGDPRHSVGTILFGSLGITCGRLDVDVPEDHSVTAFREGLWEADPEGFEPISFL